MNLLNNYNELPEDVQDVLNSFDDSGDAYAECKRIVADLEALGFSADYGLDGEICDLRKLSGMEKTNKLRRLLFEKESLSAVLFSEEMTNAEARRALFNMDRNDYLFYKIEDDRLIISKQK